MLNCTCTAVYRSKTNMEEPCIQGLDLGPTEVKTMGDS